MPFFYNDIYEKLTYLMFLLFAFQANAIPIPNTDIGLVAIVKDAHTNKPMESVSIYNSVKSFAAATNTYGEANVHSLALEDSITFSYIGYQTINITLCDLLRKGGRIYMEEGLFLQEFTVKGVSRADEHIDNIPAQIDIIKAKDIALFNPQTAADALLNTGNIFIQKSQMGGGSPVIRGFEANKVLIVIDGVRMNNAIYRNGHLQNAITIDNNMLERVEVVYGPAAVIYGSDALGGVMSFTSKRPRLAFGDDDEVFEGNAFVRFSSANKERTGHFDFTFGGRKWSSLSSVTVASFDDLRTGSKNRPEYIDFGRRFSYVDRINNQDSVVSNQNPLVQVGTGYNQVDVLQKILFQANRNLNFLANIQYSTSSDVPRYDQLADAKVSVVDGIRSESFRFAEWYYGPQKRFLSSLTMEYKPTDNRLFNSLSVVTAYQKIDEDRISRRFGRVTRSFEEEDVHVGSLNIDFSKSIKSTFKKRKEEKRFLYGLEANYNRVNSNAYDENILTGVINNNGVTRYPDGGSDMTMLAAYLSYRQRFRNKVNITAGVRYSYVSLQSRFVDTTNIRLPYTEINSNLAALTGSVSMAWDVGKNWYINAIASTAFRSPNVDDFGKIRAKDDYIVIPNPDLSSEYALNGELGITKKIETKNRSHSISGTAFYTYLFDAIVRDFTTLNGSDSLLYYGDYYTTQWNTNAGTAYIYGVSGNVTLELSDRWKLKSSINYLQGWNTSQNEPLAHISPLYGQTTLSYSTDKFQFRFLTRYNGWKKAEDFDFEDTDNLGQATVDGSPSWYTLNTYMSFNLSKNMFLTLAFENILDTHYRSFSSGVSAPGRNVAVSLRTKF
jgi:hemoglobin/transferrin/lactoferrin receptor protein